MNTDTTFNRVRVLPYATHSQGAAAIASALGGKRIRLEGSTYQPRPKDLVINWGNSSGFKTGVPGASVLNGNPDLCLKASNKLLFFQNFQGKDWLPNFWTNQEDIPDEAFPIVCRTSLTGHSGAGIVIANSRDDLVPAPLYVTYIKKKHEYRVHVGTYNDGQGNTEFCVISLQQKKRRTDYEKPNWKIRNHANGFIYARQDVSPPVGVVRCAIDCLDGSGLDFGAVDVIWNETQGKAYVLEINTAPGLEGSTVDDYVRYFKGQSKTLNLTEGENGS